MTPSEERRIEKLIRRPEAMTGQEQARAERLVEEDPGAALYASFLRDFYDRLKEEKRREPDPRVDEFVGELFSAGAPGSRGEASVVPVEPRDPGPQVRPTVLAADAPASATNKEVRPQDSNSEDPEQKRFVLLASLMSEEERVLVRALGDRKTGRGWLYVLPGPGEEARNKEPHALVSFPKLGRNILTDEDGRASFELHPESGGAPSGPGPAKKWSDAHAVVRRPVAAEKLEPGEEAILSLPRPDGPEGRLLCRREGGTLAVTTEGDETRAFLAVTPPEGEPTLLSLRAGGPAPKEVPLKEVSPKDVLPKDVPLEGPVTLRLYK